MNFTSIEEITRYFGLSEKTLEEIKIRLTELRNATHPNSNRGEFKDEGTKERYFDIQSALEFLDENVTALTLASKTDIVALTNVLRDLSTSQKEESMLDKVSKKDTDLTNKISESIKIFQKRQNLPKITGFIITSIMTALLAFPNIAKDQPLLSILYKHNFEFTLAWVSSLIISAVLWLITRVREGRDENIKKLYKLEATQNHIFTLFVDWMLSNYKYDQTTDDRKTVRFSKDDFIKFLNNRYEILSRFLIDTDHLSKYKLQDEIRHFEEMTLQGIQIRKIRKGIVESTLDHIFPVPGEINLEIAQILADLIIERLTSKEAITKMKEKKLSDFYEYIE